MTAVEYTERQKAEFWEKGWKRLLHLVWAHYGIPSHGSSVVGNRFLRAGQRSVRARQDEGRFRCPHPHCGWTGQFYQCGRRNGSACCPACSCFVERINP